MTRIMFLLPLMVFLVVVGYFSISLQAGRDSHDLPSAMINKPAPPFDLDSLGTTQRLALNRLRGQPFIINFFASWCAPCRIEHPLLMRLSQQNHAPLYGISYKDEPTSSMRLLSNFGDPYRQIGVDHDGRVGLDFGVYGVPETYVIDADGRIRRRFVGPLTAEAVDKELLPLLKQLERQ